MFFCAKPADDLPDNVEAEDRHHAEGASHEEAEEGMDALREDPHTVLDGLDLLEEAEEDMDSDSGHLSQVAAQATAESNNPRGPGFPEADIEDAEAP